MAKTKQGHELIFISLIFRDGSGTQPVTDDSHLQRGTFNITCLSMSMETYIASGFNSYVVKLKNPAQLPYIKG